MGARFANKEAIDANKRELKSKFVPRNRQCIASLAHFADLRYVAAKELGQSVNQVRKEITACKAAIEQIRLKKVRCGSVRLCSRSRSASCVPGRGRYRSR